MNKIEIKKDIILNNEIYNKNYIIKNIGYFQNYIYKYIIYVSNKKILDPFIIQNKICIIYICNKNNIEENITGMEFILNYEEFLFLLDTKIKIKEKEYSEKELRNLSIIIKIGMHKDIAESRIAATALKEFNKKLLKFQKVINKLVEYKVKVGKSDQAYKQEYSRFLTERILAKELKPVLHIKIMDEEDQAECLKHLLNLMSKKGLNVDFDTFKYGMHKTIKGYQDNYEHDDAG